MGVPEIIQNEIILVLKPMVWGYQVTSIFWETSDFNGCQ